MDDRLIRVGDGVEFGQVRVKDVGVLATPNTFTLNVDKFLPTSLSHDSLFSKMRAISVRCEDFQTENSRQKTGFLQFGVPKQDEPELKLINHPTYLLPC